MKLADLLACYVKAGTPSADELDPRDLPADISQWPQDWRDQYEERAAVLEYSSGADRRQAETTSEELVRQEHVTQRITKRGNSLVGGSR